MIPPHPHTVTPLLHTNYVGHFATSDLLPQLDAPGWALVGALSRAVPYVFYTEPGVPYGYMEGWNDLSAVLGTYDLTQSVLTVADRYLITEYNVSNNHTQSAWVYNRHWLPVPYYTGYLTHQEGAAYRPNDRVNVTGFTDYSFVCRHPTAEAPVLLYPDTNRFTLAEALVACPEEYRLLGLKLTFVNRFTALSETWAFLAPDITLWSDRTYWVKMDMQAQQNTLLAEEVEEDRFLQPTLVADRAIADEQGRNIADTYLTKDAAAEFIKDIING